MYAHIYAGRKKKLIEERTQNEIRAQVVDDLLHNSPNPDRHRLCTSAAAAACGTVWSGGGSSGGGSGSMGQA